MEYREERDIQKEERVTTGGSTSNITVVISEEGVG